MKVWFGYGWATPVTSRKWAVVATLADRVARLTGYRFPNGHMKHLAWQMATGGRRAV